MQEVRNRFVFVTPYFDCSDEIETTIFSMLAQSFGDWRAILIDDMSTDAGPLEVERLVQNLPKKHRDRFTLLRNEVKHGEVRNTLQALDMIDDDEVVCRLDGGDWLVENDLLKIVDASYNNPRVGVAWTAHRWGYTHQNISGPMRLESGTTVYQHPWVSSHLKTFRAKHLRGVPARNFLDDAGSHIVIACDQAIFLPMMHKCFTLDKTHDPHFIPAVGYHYNIDLTRPDLFTNDRSIRQKQSAEWIRKRGYVE